MRTKPSGRQLRREKRIDFNSFPSSAWERDVKSGASDYRQPNSPRRPWHFAAPIACFDSLRGFHAAEERERRRFVDACRHELADQPFVALEDDNVIAVGAAGQLLRARLGGLSPPARLLFVLT